MAVFECKYGGSTLSTNKNAAVTAAISSSENMFFEQYKLHSLSLHNSLSHYM